MNDNQKFVCPCCKNSLTVSVVEGKKRVPKRDKPLSRKYAKGKYRDIRVDANLSTHELAELAGVSGCTVSNFERGANVRKSTKQKLNEIYSALGGAK